MGPRPNSHLITRTGSDRYILHPTHHQAQAKLDYQILLRYCINVSQMLPDTGRKMDLLNSWPPAVGTGLIRVVEVGVALGFVIGVPESVLRGGRRVADGVDGEAVILKVVHMDAGGAEYSSHWP